MNSQEILGRPYVSLVLVELANHGLIDLNDPKLKMVRPVCDEIVGLRILHERQKERGPSHATPS